MSSTRGPEGALQDRVMAELKQMAAGDPRFFVEKLSLRDKAGMPDVMIIYRGAVMFMELKAEQGRTSKLQRLTAQRLGAAGAVVHIPIRTLEAALAAVFRFIDRVDRMLLHEGR